MRINNNIMALNTHRQYNIANSGSASAAEKLSSGYRINRAGDDAAGLAISEKMRAQIKGLNMASKNSQDAVSLVQTAEGALQESHNILQRMRELSVQASSDTNDEGVDRAALNEEFQALKEEINNISEITHFNGKKLLDGTFGSQIDTDTAESTVLTVAGVLDVEAFGVGGASYEFGTAADGKITITRTQSVLKDPELDTATNTYTYFDPKLAASYVTVTDTDEVSVTAGAGSVSSSKFGINIKTGVAFAADGLDGAKIALQGTAHEDSSAQFQTGANKGETLELSIGKMNAQTLGIGGANIATRGTASNSIETVNRAINLVSTQRAKLGAVQNRLNHKIANLDTSAENLSAAESRIRDIDMAKEMTNFTKQNILSQAATAMLAQANSAPQNVLQLLR